VSPGAPVAAEVARAARLLAAAGLVEAFGHVSAREGDGFVITSTRPLGTMEAGDVGPPGAPGRPLETPLHAAIYRARPDVGAICRTHSPAATAWGARGEAPPLAHGLGGLSGEIAVDDATDLVADAAAGDAAARALGAADVLLVRANGAVCTGADLPAACTRAWFLEERARVALDAGPAARPLDAAERAARARHHPTEAARAWQWLAWRFPGADDPTVRNEGETP
jgi:ribulose-5-phosphate 4-epimerase/fuculose-1-phosphate aldolase